METQGPTHFFEHEDRYFSFESMDIGYLLLYSSILCFNHYFLTSLQRFWDLLAPFCTVNPVVNAIPLVSSLCRGCGKTASIDGKVSNLCFLINFLSTIEAKIIYLDHNNNIGL